ncbi:MAG: hypothetical protein ACHREM_21405 [Polyangiales bacterium]
MSTKAEQVKAETEQANARANASEREAKHQELSARHKRPESHESTHAADKATHAFETHAPGTRPSRKSTRKGANHLKADAAFNHREQSGESAPQFRHDEAAATNARVRGHG